MKKCVIVFSMLALFSATAFSQDAGGEVLTRKGHPVLPAAGDIGLGFNAVPMFDLLLNSMRYVSIMGNSAPAATGVAANAVTYTQANNQITGKYYLTDESAIRVRFGVNSLSGSILNKVEDAKIRYEASMGTQDDINAAKLITVEDRLSFDKSNIMFSAGYEMRRGYRRLQGYYGGELGFGVTSSRQSVTYGNAFSDVYTVDYTSNFNLLTVSAQNPNATRVERDLDRTHRGTFNMGLRGFIGVEYFVFQKISVGVEYGFGYAIQTLRAGHFEREVYNNGENGPTVFTEHVKLDRTERSRGFSVDNNNGNLFSMNNTLAGSTALAGGSAAIAIIFHF